MDTKTTAALPPQNLASAYAVPQNQLASTPAAASPYAVPQNQLTTPAAYAPTAALAPTASPHHQNLSSSGVTPHHNLASSGIVPHHQNLSSSGVAPHHNLATSGIVPHHQNMAGSGIGAPLQKIGHAAAAAGILPNNAARFLGSDNRAARSSGFGLDGRSARSALGLDGRASRTLGLDSRAARGGMSDETELSKRIMELHESDEHGLAVKPVLNVIDVIFHRATADLPGFTEHSDIVKDDKANVIYSVANLQDNVEIPARIVSAISCEILSKCSAGVDVHTITMEILNIIKHYGWDSKVLLALVAFAVTFGEFRLVLQQYSTNPLAKAVAILKQLPELLEHSGALKPKLDALYDLIKEIIDVTKKIVDFYDLPRNEYFTAESPELLAAASHIPTAVYWTIRSIVVSSTQILALTGMGIEYLTEPWELSSLAHKLNNIKGHVVDIIERCYKFVEKQKQDEAYEYLVRIFQLTHIDNSKPLRVLFNEDPNALYDCYNKKRIVIEDLKRKVVALFITEVDPELIRSSEYAILQQMYAEKRHSMTRSESQYEVVWVPISNVWNDEKYRVFDRLKEQMEWHSVHHPSAVTPVAPRFFREKWGFVKKPMLVVIDTQGRVVHHNAIHMMCIWGSLAYPFTANREKLLWEDNAWTMDLLIDGLDPSAAEWIQQQKHVCVYGGEDIDWIRKFTRIAKEVARTSGIHLELLYVGKSKPHEKATRNIIDIIQNENLSRTLDWNLIWYFWMRLESMWHSKGQLTTSASVKTDHVMQGIIAILSYGSSSQGWAAISRGFEGMAKGNGEHMYRGLAEHDQWRTRELEVGFVPALIEYLEKLHIDAPHHCTSLILPATGAMPDTVACSECGRLMERYTMFRCCLDY
ncbi:protein SIEVE ELEMENT OCCLUSION B [Cannabis sativa]|uniref:protein SIEVE ELEMENT OCCLUSION B n=1 Tax=Cannabis sativa TaxID=3483 RepID=UPI0029CA2B45|nr:protein SIEVE ELEMENT OCCLUSION B [Cannabis sativa]